MRTDQGSMFNSLGNAKTFLDEHADTLGNVISTRVYRDLDECIAELSGHASTQNGQSRAAKSAIAQRVALEKALVRDHMAPLSRIARLELGTVPALVSFGLPQGRMTPARLAAFAKGMAEAAESHAEVFINAGLPHDFIQKLRDAADAMLAALNAKKQSRGKVRSATSALSTKLSRARKVVNVLDAMVTSSLTGNPDLLAGWKLVKRVQRVGKPSPVIGTASDPAAEVAA